MSVSDEREALATTAAVLDAVAAAAAASMETHR